MLVFCFEGIDLDLIADSFELALDFLAIRDQFIGCKYRRFLRLSQINPPFFLGIDNISHFLILIFSFCVGDNRFQGG